VGERLRAVDRLRVKNAKTLAIIEVTDVRREVLAAIYYEREGTAREGFPLMTCEEFVNFFCKFSGAEPFWTVTRIEFKYVSGEQGEGGE
jgi:hypothetical protein